MLKSYLLFLLCTLVLVISSSSSSQEQQCESVDDQLFVTFHPHLDAFWLNTDTQLKNIQFKPVSFLYNMNQRNSKQIYNSMLQALSQNPIRKYFTTQVVFFQDWYYYLSSQKQKKVKQLINNGQLQIVNGGWVQNDQAVCYYDDILDQYTLGTRFLFNQFGYVSKIGWATDSFGHSHSQVALQHLLGIQFQGIERVDDRYIYQRKGEPLLQFYWQSISQSTGLKYGGVFTHVRSFLHEVNNLRSQSTSSIIDDFTKLKKHLQKIYSKNKLFRFLGNDFEEFNSQEFSNFQNAMLKINKNRKCDIIKYGNPNDYLKELKKSLQKKQVLKRRQDFLSNWDQDHYWSGYYTTNPDLKKICKDYSRLINLYRKIIFRQTLKLKNIYQNNKQLLINSQQLLAVMQHHDGITATSKYYILQEMKQRIKKNTNKIIQSIKKIQNKYNQQICLLYSNNNRCKITKIISNIQFNIYHDGLKKQQLIILELPISKYYKLKNIQFSIFCQKLNCLLIFNAILKQGNNYFQLNLCQKQKVIQYITQSSQYSSKYQNQYLSIEVIQNIIVYSAQSQYFHIGYFQSNSHTSLRQTVSWNKYGQKTKKGEPVNAGIYIMSNNGQINPINHRFGKMKVISDKKYTQIYLQSSMVTLQITIQNKSPLILNYLSTFKPDSTNNRDYFIKIDSSVKSEKQQFYHDSNGFLVKRRKINQRPDYDWEYKKQDKINANTYPACTFAYIHDSTNKKMIVFLDRAQGVTLFDKSLMINIDRLAMEDGKGIGQFYNFVVKNTFHHKFAILKNWQFPQRIWQRKYDQALIGFMKPLQSQIHLQTQISSPVEGYLKYMVQFLKQDEILIRFHNMGQTESISIPRFSSNKWQIPLLNLNIQHFGIKQSFANGIIFSKRFNWIKDNTEINIFTSSNKDTEIKLNLQPLQIRSFKINLISKNQQISFQNKGFNFKPIEINNRFRRCF